MKPRVVLFHESYPDHYYGAQKTLAYIIEFMDRSRYSAIVLCNQEGVLTERLRTLGADVVIIPLHPSLRATGGVLKRSRVYERPLQFLRLLPFYRSVRSLMKSRNVDLVFCNNPRSLLLCGPPAKLLGLPVIWPLRRDQYNRLQDTFNYFLADRVVAVSDGICTAFRKHRLWRNSPKLVRSYAGIPLEEFTIGRDGSRVRAELGFGTNECVVGVTASMSPRKGLETFIRMAAILAADLPGVRFVIVGGGDDPASQAYEAALRLQAADLINVGKLVFAGWRDDIADVYAAFDIFVLTSLVEGLPRGVLEAMAMGKPVVATPVGGTPEVIIEGETGFMVGQGDASTFAERVRALVLDRALREQIGTRAAIRVRQEFEVAAAVRRIENSIDDVLAQSERA